MGLPNRRTDASLTGLGANGFSSQSQLERASRDGVPVAGLDGRVDCSEPDDSSAEQLRVSCL